ncbi:hypothetical protein THAOC_21564 [Thalassiosira oceanica]|uniref:RxLR effector protein n=1 Tax=Thalassiosira oceanica TaxID=159749 RepID=K0RX32_THAOC|nr:hypothetical protein THAOC_21564 [Thalassiosira oceanica]|eukprot:EJK58328.1 hypothetical protein THAOC_21564 [Thalassiosira oceanica]
MSSSLPLILCVATCLPVSRAAQHESVLLPEIDPIKDELLIQKSSLPAFADPSSADGNSAEVVYRERLVMYDFRPAYPPYKTETLDDLMLMPTKSNTVGDDISDDDVPSAFEQEHIHPDDQSSGETVANESVDESTLENVGGAASSVDAPIDRAETDALEGADDSDDDSSPQHPDEEATTPPAEEEESQVDSSSSGNGAEIDDESNSLEYEADEEIITPPVADPANDTGIKATGKSTSAEMDASENAELIEADSSSAEHQISRDEVPAEDLSNSESIADANGAELEYSTVGETDLESGIAPNDKAHVPPEAVESSDGDDMMTEETEDKEISGDPARLANETNLDAPETTSKVTVETAATLDEKPTIDNDDVSGVTVGDEIIGTRVDGIESANEMSLEDEKSLLDQGLTDNMKTQHEYNAAEQSEKATVSNDDVLSPSTMTATSSNNSPDANRQFVTGLDEIDKLFESVEAPDELDVGADGSSMQDVIVGQGIKIAWKRARNFGSEIRNRFEKVADSVQKALPQLGMFGEEDEETEETLESLLSKMDMSRDGGQEAIHEPAKRPERPKPVKTEKESKQFPLMKSPKAKKIWKFAQRKWHQARHLLDDILNLFADDDEEEEDEDIASLLKYGALGGAGAKFGSRMDESFLNEQRQQKQ